MPTELTYTIDPDGSGDYASLAAAEADLRQDLTSTDVLLRLQCISSGGSIDTVACFFQAANWVCDNTRYIIIEAGEGYECKGAWVNSVYRRSSYLRMEVEKVIIEGLTIKNDTVGALGYGIYLDAQSSGFISEVKKCFIVAQYYSFYGYYGKYNISNCLFVSLAIGASINVYGVGYSGEGLRLHNCTLITVDQYNLEVGTDQYIEAKNCIFDGATLKDINKPFNPSLANLNYCASSDGTADDYSGANNRVNQTFTFADETNKVFALLAADAGAKGYGTDLSGDSDLPVTDDIRGADRQIYSAWDIGAFLYNNTSNLLIELLSLDSYATRTLTLNSYRD